VRVPGAPPANATVFGALAAAARAAGCGLCESQSIEADISSTRVEERPREFISFKNESIRS